MKAQNLKQHKLEFEYETVEDAWGDKTYVVEGIAYVNEIEAKKAIHELITKEFNERYLNKKDKHNV